MTIINPNSIAGITSVTAQAGVMNFYKSDGTLAGLQLNGVNFNTTSGISTFNNVYVGGTITYEDVKNVDSIGIVTARSGVDITADNKYLKIGAGNDISIVHTGSESYISNATGHLTRRSDVHKWENYAGNAEYVRIDSNGNMALGTNSPNNYSNYTTFTVNGTTGGQIDVESNGTKYGDIYTQSNAFHIRNKQASGNGSLVFHTTSGGTSAERVRIDSSGRLLIGTTTEGNSVADDLTIAGSGDSGITIRSGTSSEGSLMFSDATSGSAEYAGWVCYNHNSNFMRFFTAATERLRIDSSGRVLIGTTTEGSSGADELTINTASGHGGMTIRNDTSSNGNIWFSDGTSGAAEYAGYVQYAHNGDHMVFGTNGGERLRIDSNGCVRVGNTATQTTSSNTKRIALGAKGSIWGWTSGNINGCIQLIDNYYWDGSNNKAIEADHCAYLSLRSGTLRFGSTNSTQTAGQNVSGGINERLRITSDGEICIGRTSAVVADTKLNIQCDATKPAIAIQCGHTNTNTDLITAWNSGGKNIVNISAETDNSPFLKFDILSGNNPVERFRINHYGNVGINGATALSNRVEIIDDPKGFPTDSAQPKASILIKHGTSGSNRRWVGIGASLTGAWLQSSSPGGSGLAAPFTINPGGGNVGIRSTAPASHLDLCASAPEIRLTNTATSRAYLSWYNHYGGVKKNANISYNEGNANWEFKLYRADGQANSPYGNIQFFTGSTSSPTLAMNITRPGSVTMPKQPCCVMYASSALTWSSGWTKIPLNNTRFDIGNNFDSGNNRYSIPITGKYAIGCNAEMNIGSGQTWIYFAPRINRNDTTSTNAGINYADFAPVSNNSSNHYFVYQGHWLANLSQGDTVTFEVHGAGNSFTVANNTQSHYYIYQVA